MKKIYLIAGHSESDSGAIAGEYKEHDIVRNLAYAVHDTLTLYGFDVEVLPTNLSLTKKIEFLNKKKEEAIGFSLHMNSAGSEDAHGCESWYLSFDQERQKFAQEFIVTYAYQTGLYSRGAKGDTTNRHGRLGIIRDVKTMPVYLIECGFISNHEDRDVVMDKGAFALSYAIYSQLTGKHMPQKPPQSDPSEDHKLAWDWAKSVGITNGDRPKDPITREENVTMLFRMFQIIQKEYKYLNDKIDQK